MIIDTIPFEVFLNYVFPYLMSMDIQKLTIVSKEMKTLCENNEIWKEIYIRKRKREFYQKEFPLAKKRALTLKNEVVQRPLGITPEKVSLIFQNESNIDYKLFYCTSGNYRRPQVCLKGFGKVKSGCNRVISSYFGHTWIVRPYGSSILCEKEVYETHVFTAWEDDVYPCPVKELRSNGEVKVFEKPIMIRLGKTYDNESAKEKVGLTHPNKVRNYKDFKKMHKRSLLPKMKKLVELKGTDIQRLDGQITRSQLKLKRSMEEMKRLQESIDMDLRIKEEKQKSMVKAKDFIQSCK